MEKIIVASVVNIMCKKELNEEQKALVILETEMHLNSLHKIHLEESDADVYLRFHFKGGGKFAGVGFVKEE